METGRASMRGLLVEDVMTRKVVTLTEGDTLQTAEDGMKRFRIRHLPVVSDEKLVGLVSLSDLLHASSSWLSEAADARDAVIHQQPVSKIMTRDLITVGERDTLVDAARLMWETKVGCLPVTGPDDKLVGVLTEADFVKLVLRTGDSGRPPPPSAVPSG